MTELELLSVFNGFHTADWYEIAVSFSGRLTDWVAVKYKEAPALTVGVVVALLLPVVATSGVLVRLTFGKRRNKSAEDHVPPTVRTRPRSAWRHAAWLEFADSSIPNYQIRSALVRIGREADNDLTLNDPKVHRYHAVVERTPDAEYMITYLGDPDRAGLRVNGESTQRQRLRGGEILEIGSIKLRFVISTD